MSRSAEAAGRTPPAPPRPASRDANPAEVVLAMGKFGTGGRSGGAGAEAA